MIRKEAIETCMNKVGDSPVVSANGFISRDVFTAKDKKTNFYMIGSMGLASSIGLGIALKKPRKKIFVFDGDGNILMNLGSLVTIGSLQPNNLVHIIFDNKIHESTGGQPTFAEKIDISKIAKMTNYTVFSVKTKKALENMLKKCKIIKGPVMIHVIVTKSNERGSRVEISPKKITNRFMSAIN